MGIPLLRDGAEAAYVACWHGVLPEIMRRLEVEDSAILAEASPILADVVNLVDDANRVADDSNVGGPILRPRSMKVTQKRLVALRNKQVLQEWEARDDVSDSHRAWAKSCGGPGAGAWLLPATSPAHVLTDTQFKAAVKLRLFGNFLDAECPA